MAMNLVLALQLLRLSLIFGDLTAPNEGVSLDVVERPPQYRTVLITSGEHDATILFAAVHDGGHTLRWIDPHFCPVLALGIVEDD